VSWYHAEDTKGSNIAKLERSYREKKRRQAGVEFPSAKTQEQLLIIRFNISPSVLEKDDLDEARSGLRQLCIMFDEMDKGNIKIDNLLPNGEMKMAKLSDFNFSATVGFGKGFFEKLKINPRNYPKKLKEMPNHIGLGDSKPYSLWQTDFIIQLCSTHEDVNRWVFQHFTAKPIDNDKSNASPNASYYQQKRKDGIGKLPNEIYLAVFNWAQIVDMHAGFQRIDGRNLLGFNDGISNPRRLSNDVVWTTIQEEDQKFTDGTYMVFQKIEHDLEKWQTMSVEEQEELIGRSKGTGLLLGTLPKEQDRKLASDMRSENQSIRQQALRTWKKLYDEQKDPDRKFFDTKQRQYRDIQLQCPVGCHVRKSNPRQSQGAARSLIYRRGYLFIERGEEGVSNSGLLFICFQKDIEKGFEHIKKEFLNKDLLSSVSKKDFITGNSKNDAVNSTFLKTENATNESKSYFRQFDGSNIPRDGQTYFKTPQLKSSGSSSVGNYSHGQIPGTVTLGGGYYFIPPIPNKRISDLSEQFFI
jgi:Dyp-type peroxidase family